MPTRPILKFDVSLFREKPRWQKSITIWHATWRSNSAFHKRNFTKYLTYKKERDKGVPKVGTAAPDFEVEMLTPEGGADRGDVQLILVQGKTDGAPHGIIYVTAFS